MRDDEPAGADHDNAPLDAGGEVSLQGRGEAGKRAAQLPLPGSPPRKKLVRDPPAHFVCPITGLAMKDPVMLFTEAGRSYERWAIEKHICLHPFRDPLTNHECFEPLRYFPNRDLKEAIEAWRRENGSVEQDEQDEEEEEEEDNFEADDDADLVFPDLDAERATRLLVAARTAAERVRAARSLEVSERCSSHTRPSIQAAFENDDSDDVNPAAPVARAIPPLVQMLGAPGNSEPERAASALAALNGTHEHTGDIARAGAIGPLVDLVKSGTDDARGMAAGVLCNLASDDDNKVAIARAGAIGPLVDLVKSGTDDARGMAAGVLCNLASDDDSCAAISRAGAIGPLVDLVKSGTDDTSGVAAMVLTNLAVNDDNKVAIVRAGAIGPLVDLVKSASDTTMQRAAGAIWNVAESEDARVWPEVVGAIDPLYDIIRSGPESAKELCTLLVSRLSHDQDNLPKQELLSGTTGGRAFRCFYRATLSIARQ